MKIRAKSFMDTTRLPTDIKAFGSLFNRKPLTGLEKLPTKAQPLLSWIKPFTVNAHLG
jgi:hypothetical protein